MRRNAALLVADANTDEPTKEILDRNIASVKVQLAKLLDFETMIPAVGQGIIGCEIRQADTASRCSGA